MREDGSYEGEVERKLLENLEGSAAFKTKREEA